MSNNVSSGIRSLKEDDIRLIRILPGSWEDEIQCELVYNSLRTLRPYHTLSYVWGSPKVTQKILMDRQVVLVTVNLESALRHLRSRLQGTLLWVDALCINQADNVERTHQVKMMGDIYRLSKSVLIYLGDGVGRDGHSRNQKVDESSPPITAFSEDDENDLSMTKASLQNKKIKASGSAKPATQKRSRTMQDTAQVFSFIRALCCVLHLTEIPLLSSENHSSAKDSDFIRVFENLRQLMHAPFTPWWNRIWVVQEVVLPPEVTVICGTVSAPWTMFAHAAAQCLHHIRHCCSDHARSLPRDALNVLQDFCYRVQDIDFLRATMKTGSARIELSISTVTNTENERRESEERSLISLLRRFRGRKAPDPRDKVYALLSLVKSTSNRPPFHPDYTLSDAEVYIKAALESIYCSASLSVLSLDVARKYRQDLPSWVPDFEAPGDFSHDARMETTRLYNACSNFLIDSSTVRPYGRALGVHGKYVTRVAYVGDVMLSESPESIRQVLSNWFHYLEQFNVDARQLPWTTLLADVIHYRQTVNTKVSFRRTEMEDEIMFVTWAVLSKLSPFWYGSIRESFSLSPTAIVWTDILLLETAIAAKSTKDAALHFRTLFPEASVQKRYILEAFDMESDFKASEDQKRDHMESADYATQSLKALKSRDWQRHLASKADDAFAYSDAQVEVEYQVCCERSERKRLQAWRHIPWPKVLQIVRPQLIERLAGASKTGRMSHGTQISIMDNSIVSATKARRFFVTSEGNAGLGPADLAKNDEIFLIKGGQTPFVLRLEKERDIGQVSSLYKVVGDCYAHRLMDSDTIEEQLNKACSSWKDWRQILLI